MIVDMYKDLIIAQIPMTYPTATMLVPELQVIILLILTRYSHIFSSPFRAASDPLSVLPTFVFEQDEKPRRSILNNKVSCRSRSGDIFRR